MTPFELELPATDSAVLLWTHVCVIWIVVNYAHRLDPLDRADARSLEGEAVRRWRGRLALRAILAGLLVPALTGFHGGGVVLGLLLAGGAYVLPESRVRAMRATDPAGWQDFRAEWEIALNVLALTASALFVGSTGQGLEFALLAVPMSGDDLVSLLLVAGAAIFLVRGGSHVVRGVLEKSDTFPEAPSPGGRDELRHGVTIGNIERLLIFLLALVGSYGAIGLVVAAKGVVRAVEWKDRTFVEYFLIGTLASAALAVTVGIGIRALVTRT